MVEGTSFFDPSVAIYPRAMQANSRGKEDPCRRVGPPADAYLAAMGARTTWRFGGTAVALALLTVGCGIPRDPEGTLERVRGGLMRVGITEHPPWTVLDDAPTGVEVDLVEGFARLLDAEIEWFPGSEHDLLTALHRRELDLVIGGYTDDDPWAKEATFTEPYATIRVVVGAPPGRAPPSDIEGLSVAARSGTEIPSLVDGAGGVPERVENLTADGLVAAEEWELRSLGLVPGDAVLAESRHAMAVPAGENAWLVRLERYLAEKRGSIDDLLDRHAGP
jgi:polar amino acid transport system substrate-binding protein